MKENFQSQIHWPLSAPCCCSVTKSCLTLHPQNCSTPGFPALHYLPEFAQTHVHWVGDAIQPSHPLWSPSPALNLSQHQGLWDSSSHQVAKELELQHQSFQWILRTDLRLTGSISSQFKGLSGVFSNTRVKKYQFFSAQLSLWSNSHSYMTTGKPIAFTRWTFVSEYYNMASVLCFSLLAVRHRGSNSPNRDQIHTPLNWKWNPNFWTAAREVPPQQILHVRTEESRRLNYLWSHSWKKKKAALEPSFQARWSWTPCSWLQMVHDLPAFSVFVITWTYISLWPWAIH